MARSSRRRTLATPLLLLFLSLLAGGMIAAPAAARQDGEVPMIGFPAESRDFQGGQTGQGFATTRSAAQEIDAFWRATFADAGATYRSPSAVVLLEGYTRTACGPASPETSFAFYCPADEQITFSPIAVESVLAEFGDYALITILAHEWGHHVQTVLNAPDPGGNTFELQADCLAGSWTLHAQTLGLLDKGDIAEAANVSMTFGDDFNRSQQEPGSHGINDDRITAFMSGYIDGVMACDLPFGGLVAPTAVAQLTPAAAAPAPAPSQAQAPSNGVAAPRGLPPAPRVTGIPASPAAYLPQGLALPHAACFTVASEGPITWEEMLQRFSDMPNAATDLGELSWMAAETRQFGCDGTPPGRAGWIDVAIHRFGTPAFAQGAVPYYVAARIANTPFIELPAPNWGEASGAVSGPAGNGNEVTWYATQGSLLVRVTGVAAEGDPTADVEAVTRQVLGTIRGGEPAADPAARTALQLLPAGPAVPTGACFRTVARGVHTPAAVRQVTGDAFAALEWQDGAYIDFRCDSPPPGGAAYIGVVLHHFATPPQAAQARTIWEGWGTDPASEARACGTSGTVLACVTAIGPDGPPVSDAAQVLRQIIGG
jgi:predicted metalloprotease